MEYICPNCDTIYSERVEKCGCGYTMVQSSLHLLNNQIYNKEMIILSNLETLFLNEVYLDSIENVLKDQIEKDALKPELKAELSNAEKRKLKLITELENNEDYKRVKTENSALKKKNDSLKLEIEYLKRKLRIMIAEED